MVVASEIQPRTVLKLDDRMYKVFHVVHHAGTGKMAGFTFLKLKDMRSAHLSERRFKPTDKLEDVDLTKKQMEYISTMMARCFPSWTQQPTSSTAS